MASHFATIGIDVADEEALTRLVNIMLDDPDLEPAGVASDDLVWTDPSGARVTLEVEEDTITGVMPSFIGSTPIAVRDIVEVDDEPDLATLAVVDKEGELLYPVILELDNRALLRASEGAIERAEVILAGLVEEIVVYPDEAAFDAAQEAMEDEEHEGHDHEGHEGCDHSADEDDDEEIQMAANSFVPCGMFAETEDGEESPVALAWVNGTVLEAKRRTNALTSQEFVHLRISTYGIDSLDLLVATADLPELPAVGSVVETTVFLTGHVVQ